MPAQLVGSQHLELRIHRQWSRNDDARFSGIFPDLRGDPPSRCVCVRSPRVRSSTGALRDFAYRWKAAVTWKVGNSPAGALAAVETAFAPDWLADWTWALQALIDQCGGPGPNDRAG